MSSRDWVFHVKWFWLHRAGLSFSQMMNSLNFFLFLVSFPERLLEGQGNVSINESQQV